MMHGESMKHLWVAALLCLTACSDEQQERIAAESRQAAEELGAAAHGAKAALSDVAERVLGEFNLTAAELKKELADKGKIVRRRVKAVAAKVEETVEDAVVTTKVKVRLVQNPAIPSMVIDVDTKGGHVTLTGRVASVEQVQLALLATLEVEEVQGVTCSLKVEPDDGSGSTKSRGGE